MFEPSDIVLAKVKGYPAWPSMVIPYENLPDQIQRVKPKSIRTVKRRGGSSNKRRKIVDDKEEDQLVCVRFLADDNYIWCSSSDLSKLTKEQIESYLSKKGTPRRASPVHEAYKMALKPPELDHYVKYGSFGKPQASEDEEEYEAEETPEEDFIDEEEEESEDYVEDDAEEGEEVEEEESEMDSEFEVDQNKTPVISQDLSKNISKRRPAVLESRLKLQPLLNVYEHLLKSESAKYDKVLSQLVNAKDDIPISVVKSTNLHKVLIDILKKPCFIRQSFRKFANELIETWFDMTVEIDEIWNETIPEPTPEPETEEVKEESKQESKEESKEEKQTEQETGEPERVKTENGVTITV